MGEDRSSGAGPMRRRLLVGLLAVLLGVAAWWGPGLREAAALATIRGAIADHDWARAEALLGEGSPAAGQGAAQRQFLLGRVYRRQRRFAEAERCFDAAAGLGFSGEEIARQRLLARAQSGDVATVEERIGGMLAEGADDAFAEDCYEALAEGFIGSFRMDDARECLEFWSRWQPANPLPSFWRGVIEERYERPVLALEHFARALAMNPRDHEARVRVARLELDTARLDEAQRHFRECLAARPDDPRAVLGLADSLQRAGDQATARDLYHEALTTDVTPEQASAALTELGQMALEAGEVGRGAMLLDQAVRVDPRGTRARLTLAAALLRLGDEEGAKRERDTAQRLAERQRRLATITHEALGKPDDPGFRAEAGAILLEAGFEEEGLKWLETALRIEPGHGPSHRVLADHFAARGDAARAARHRALAGDAPLPGPSATSEGGEKDPPPAAGAPAPGGGEATP